MRNLRNKEKLNIVHFGQKNCMIAIGGVEVVVAEIATRQAAMGHHVTCINRDMDYGDIKAPKPKKWKGIRMKYVPTIPIKGLAAVTSAFFATLSCAFGNYDVVHIHTEGVSAFCWLLKLCGKKVICHNHGIDWMREKWSGSYGSLFIHYGEKMAAKYADELIVLSSDVKQYFSDVYGRETVYIPNAVDRYDYEEPNLIKKKFGLEKDSYILFLARLVPEKRVKLLIEAFRGVNTAKKLVIAGDTSDTENYYKKIKKAANGDKRIVFTGFADDSLKAELYSNSYVYVLPSDLEGMPMCLLEAMSYGNCCLTSDISECTEVIGDKGLSFTRGILEDLRAKLQMLCDDPDMVAGYKSEAADYICSRYKWQDVVKKIMELYRKQP
ncbi:MAG: glycosyltransferase family 4 protein [Lachnospiraceae bacterium]|nr:glycosyltransferase family 4 protein [Lachnospiraceae bacterium]